MQYTRLGGSGARVSRIALGLGLRGQGDAAAAERLIATAFDRGITFFDCANIYGLMDDRGYAGRAEEILGKALKRHRDEVVITSKVVSPVGSGQNDRGGSRLHIAREVERSLRRLDTDRIDVYLLHAFDAETPLEEQFGALDDLVRRGLVRYVGVCNYQAWQVCDALWTQERLGAHRLVTVQNPYSLLNRSLEGEMFPFVREFGLGVMAYAPIGTGLLSGTYRADAPPPEGSLWAVQRREAFARIAARAEQVLAAVTAIGRRHGATPAQVALAWVLSHGEITCAISGADTAEQIAENAAAADVTLAAEDLQALDAVSRGSRMLLDGAALG